MSEPSMDVSAKGEGIPQPKDSFSVEEEYDRCVSALRRTGIVALLAKSGTLGVVGVDGNEYPMPTLEQVLDLFAHNRELVDRKEPQGFDRLDLTPLAVPMPLLIERLEAAILGHAAAGRIHQTRLFPSDPLLPVRVNKEKHVWVWETLRQALDTDELVYFPRQYSSDHGGQTKLEAVSDVCICPVPGWSVALAESLPVMPPQGQGRTLAGRTQLEIGCSPREYLRALHTKAYEGETGKTIEDFITEFLVHLDTTDEVSNDVRDGNALWCLGQYAKIPYAEVVPTGRWIRDVGRVRLDMHRTGNKRCASSWGVSTVVRLPGRCSR